MTPTLIGYFPKRTAKRPDQLNAPAVEEICSVSCCISEGPDEWIEKWLHNECWAFDTQELAWSVVPADERATFDLYAYRMFPFRYEHGRAVEIELPSLQVEPMNTRFVRLGCDAVSRYGGAGFECSPLSCNYLAESHTVNRYCLLDSEADAHRFAIECSETEPEPGPYHLIEVWRLQTKLPGITT